MTDEEDKLKLDHLFHNVETLIDLVSRLNLRVGALERELEAVKEIERRYSPSIPVKSKVN